jgi:hypothetical protein
VWCIPGDALMNGTRTGLQYDGCNVESKEKEASRCVGLALLVVGYREPFFERLVIWSFVEWGAVVGRGCNQVLAWRGKVLIPNGKRGACLAVKEPHQSTATFAVTATFGTATPPANKPFVPYRSESQLTQTASSKQHSSTTAPIRDINNRKTTVTRLSLLHRSRPSQTPKPNNNDWPRWRWRS